jgi:hypothetical protein
MADLGHFFAEKSYIGNKKDRISTGLCAFDLMSSESNESSIHCLEHGKKESKATKTSVNALPRCIFIWYGRYY